MSQRHLCRTHGWAALLALTLAMATGCPQQTANQNAQRQPGARQARPLNYSQSAGRELVVWADPVLLPALTALQPAYSKAASGELKLLSVERGRLVKYAADGAVPGLAAPD